MEILKSDKAPKAVGPYCHGIKHGDFIFTSGQLPINPETDEIIIDDIKAAAKQALENCKAIIEEGGSSIDKVVKVTVFLVDLNDFAAVNEVYSEFFGDHKPARSCFEISKLPKDGRVEMEMIAAL